MSAKIMFERRVILVLSAVGAIAVLPFAVIRLWQADWAIAVLDSIVSSVFIGVFFYVWFTQKTTIPGVILSIFFLLTAVLTVVLKGPQNTAWLYPSMVGVFFLVGRKWGVVVNVIAIAVMLTITWNDFAPVARLTLLLSTLATNAFAYVFALSTAKQRKLLAEQARRDSLTKALNRRAFEEQLAWLVSVHQRIHSAPELIIFDIDHFKAINDEYGHDQGDRVLIQLTRVIESRLRITDQLYRIGGEEFAILPLETRPNYSGCLAEELREIVAATELLPHRSITISAGVAAHELDESVEQWFKRADQALYRAKAAGRNCVEVAPKQTHDSGIKHKRQA
ncbi:MAG: GGDEF domain-containing protein [Gammaproteobacteria bacterium]|nr:GGDEF domain-containing protein [Gammaproteobacteria bacterium]